MIILSENKNQSESQSIKESGRGSLAKISYGTHNDGVTKKYTVGILSLTLMTVAAVDNVRLLPSVAIFGKQIIFFYLLASVFFFIPCSLVSAQLSSGKGQKSGVYHWVKKAFGPQWGLTAVWLQWAENLVWYPTLLTFIVGTLGYLISPELCSRFDYLVPASVICFYLVSIVNMYGINISVALSNLCAIFGLLLPMIVIIMLGVHWYFSGSPISNTLANTEFIPDFLEVNTWVALTSIVMSLCGVEVTTSHAQKIKGAQRNYPKALLLSTFIILGTLILASLSIAIVIPSDELNLVSGIVQSLEVFLDKSGFSGMLKYFAFAAVIGSFGTLSNWLLAPIKGLQEAAKDGLLPKAFSKTNKQGVPIVLMIIQLVVVTFLVCVFYMFPNINSAYWFMTTLTSQLYMLMYLIMFFAFLKLRNNPGYLFKIPGGNKGGILIGVLGISGCFATILIGLVPYEGCVNLVGHICLVVCILVASMLMPWMFASKKRVKQGGAIVNKGSILAKIRKSELFLIGKV